MIKLAQIVRQIFDRIASGETARVDATPSTITDPFWPRYQGIKSGHSFALTPIDQRTPEEIAEDDERAWLDEAAFRNEHAAHCSTDMPASLNN